jgi:hypothetical protein
VAAESRAENLAATAAGMEPSLSILRGIAADEPISPKISLRNISVIGDLLRWSLTFDLLQDASFEMLDARLARQMLYLTELQSHSDTGADQHGPRSMLREAAWAAGATYRATARFGRSPWSGGGATPPGATEPISQSRNNAIFGVSAVSSGATM